MKKIIIPTIIAATVLIAGMFAFMPVEKAATVHLSITGSQRDVAYMQFEAGQVCTGTIAAGAGVVACTPTGVAIAIDGDSAIDPDEVIILYDGLGKTKTATIEFNTNMVTNGDLDVSGAPANAVLVLESNDGTGWSIVTVFNTATGADHIDFDNTQGLRLRINDAGAGATFTFSPESHVSLTIVDQ